MMDNPHTPCVMTDTQSFYVRICGCGVVHLCFGPTTLNLSPDALLAVTETLKDLSQRLRNPGQSAIAAPGDHLSDAGELMLLARQNPLPH